MIRKIPLKKRIGSLMQKPKPLRNWRIQNAMPFGLHVWFDPDVERIAIYGLTEAEKDDKIKSLNGSVSASAGQGRLL